MEKRKSPTRNKTKCFKPSKFLGKINSDIISGFEYIRDNLKNVKYLMLVLLGNMMEV